MMRRYALLVLLPLAVVACGRKDKYRRPDQTGIQYPETRTVDHVDDYHGTKVADPYRWLEDENGEDTKAWIDAQNQVTFGYLGRLGGRERIRKRIEALWNYERYGVPEHRGGRYFFTRNDGLQNQSVLYTTESLAEEPRVLLDPNELSEDGTVALRGRFVSRDGKLMAYAISSAGSDWREFRIREVETGQDLAADHLQWIKFSGASWNRDNTGFYYTRLPAPEAGKERTAVNRQSRIFFHRVGTPQSEDVLVYERPDHPEWSVGGGVTEDGSYLVIYASTGSAENNALFFKDLEKDGPVVEVLKDFDANYTVVGNDGPFFWIYTDLEAPKGKIVAIDLRNPARDAWQEIVPESKDTIQSVSLVGERFIVRYLHRAYSKVKLFHLDGTFDRDLPLPTEIGSTWGFTGQPDDQETFFGFSSFTYPGTIFRYDFKTRETTVFKRPEVDFDPDRFTTRQEAYRSRDGTFVTMFLTHAKGLKLDGERPTLLYGYGGFNVSITPRFSIANVVWMEMGGVYAVPNLRGGAERGEAWHAAGKLEKKQNVFDDFIAAAEALIHNRYTSSRRLAIMGGSNGGLLVGACMTQRPELFGACLPAVGVMDMLRYHKFTVGWAWVGEYGSSEDPEMFPVLHAYSPYHRIRKGVAYPPTLVTTADHDDRVVPAHSFKFAARLQAAQAGKAPVLIRIETKAGHGAGTPTVKRIEALTDRYAFLAHNLGMRVPRRLGK